MSTKRYLIMILLSFSLMTGQWGCAHTSQHLSEEMTARSAEEPEFSPRAPKGEGLRIAKGATKGLAVSTGTGALVGGVLGALVGAFLAAETGGIGIVALPYLAAGGAAIGGAIGGVSGGRRR